LISHIENIPTYYLYENNMGLTALQLFRMRRDQKNPTP
jgi:hypothetical protein